MFNQHLHQKKQGDAKRETAPKSITQAEAQSILKKDKKEQIENSSAEQKTKDQPQLPTVDPNYLKVEAQVIPSQDYLSKYYQYQRGTLQRPEDKSPIPVIIKSFGEGDTISPRQQEDSTLRILAKNATGFLPVYGKTSDGNIIFYGGFLPLTQIIFPEEKDHEVTLPRIIKARILYDMAKYLKEMHSPSSLPTTCFMRRDMCLGNVFLPSDFEQQFVADYKSSPHVENWLPLARMGDRSVSLQPMSLSPKDYWPGFSPELFHPNRDPQGLHLLTYGYPSEPTSYDDKLDTWRFAELAFTLWTQTDLGKVGPQALRQIFFEKSQPSQGEGRYIQSKFAAWCSPPEKGGPPRALYDLIMKRCLQKNPKNRATAEEVFNTVQAWFKNEVALEYAKQMGGVRENFSRYEKSGGKDIKSLLEGYNILFRIMSTQESFLLLNAADTQFIGNSLVKLLYAAGNKKAPNHADYHLVLGMRNYPELLMNACKFLMPENSPLDEKSIDAGTVVIPKDDILRALLLAPFKNTYEQGLQAGVTEAKVSDFDLADSIEVHDKIREQLKVIKGSSKIFNNAPEWKVLSDFIQERLAAIIEKNDLAATSAKGIFGFIKQKWSAADESKKMNELRKNLEGLIHQKLLCEAEFNETERNKQFEILVENIQKIGGNDLLQKIVEAKSESPAAQPLVFFKDACRTRLGTGAQIADDGRTVEVKQTNQKEVELLSVARQKITIPPMFSDKKDTPKNKGSDSQNALDPKNRPP